MNYQTTREIEYAIALSTNYIKNLIIPNVTTAFFVNREADLLVITPAGFCYEIEIKVTYSDFLREFRKTHKFPMDIYENDPRLKKKIFALPESLIREKYDKIRIKLPEYAGLWGINGAGYRKIHKKPVNKIGCRKLTSREISRLTRIAYYRTWAVRRQNVVLADKVQILKMAV